jgi:hypothetical protein
MKIDQRPFHFIFWFNHEWLIERKAEERILVERIPGVIPQNAALTFRYQHHGKIVVSLQAVKKAVIFKIGDHQGDLPGLRIDQCE